MQLTAHYRSIMARPQGERCPNCFRMIGDWFLEWFPVPQQQQIGRHRAAMDCPYCRQGVVLNGMKLTPNENDLPVLVRDLGQATKWAQLFYPDLESFLTSTDPLEQKRAEPFRKGYWPEVNL